MRLANNGKRVLPYSFFSWGVAIAIGIITGAAKAEQNVNTVLPPSVAFGKMPHHHTYHFRRGTKDFGNEFALRFEGYENNQFVMRRYERTKLDGPFDKLTGVWYFDKRGRLTRQQSYFLGSLKSVTEFSPYHCAFSTMTVCTHTRSFRKVGGRTLSQQKHYELALNGSNLVIIRNAKSNRIREERRLDEFGFAIEIREPSAQRVNDLVLLNRAR